MNLIDKVKTAIPNQGAAMAFSIRRHTLRRSKCRDRVICLDQTAMNLIDKVKTAIPNQGAAMAFSIGIALAGCVWAPPVEKIASTWLSIPQARLLEVQILLSLGIFGLASFVAFVLMVRAYRTLQLEHAKELAAACARPGAVAMTSSRSRAQLMRDYGIDNHP